METLTTRGWLSHGRHALGVVTWLCYSLVNRCSSNRKLKPWKTRNRCHQLPSELVASGASKLFLNNWKASNQPCRDTWVVTSKILAYREVCTGRTGHAEVVLVTFDEADCVERSAWQVFFATHDPTTLNRQGADVGTQYRSVIFYARRSNRPLQKRLYKRLKVTLKTDIVTEIAPHRPFTKPKITTKPTTS